MQASLGGSLTLPTEVCAACNDAFSSLDTDLIAHVNLFALGRVSSLLGFGLQEDPSGVRLTARLGRLGEERGLAVAPPQVFRHPNGTWRFHGPSLEVLRMMERELAVPSADVTELVDPDEHDKTPVALAIVRTAPSVFLVRGPSESEVRQLAGTLREKGLQIDAPDEVTAWVPPAEVAPIDVRSSFPVARISRCLSKIALNYVCSLFGPNVALNPAFDRLRRFARYDEGIFADFVTPTLLDHAQQDGVRAYAHPERHALVLNQLLHDSLYRVAVQIVLYGKAFGIVRLSATPEPILPLATWRVTYFDHGQKTFEHLVIPDDGLRCFVNVEALVPGAASLVEKP